MFNLYVPLIIPKEIIGTEKEKEFIENNQIIKKGKLLPLKEQDRYFLKLTLREIVQKPDNFIRRTLWRFFKLWRFYPYKDKEYHHLWLLLVIISLISYGWIFPRGLIELLKNLKKFNFYYPIYLFIITLTFIYSLSWSQIRYRLPMMPF